MNAVFHNQYNYSGAIVARLSVCTATLIWSLIVIARNNALLPTSYGALLTGVAPEDVYGWFFLFVSGSLLYRIFRPAPPLWLVAAGYGVLMLAWGFVWFALILSRPLMPTATAWVTVGAALAVYAFVANRRPQEGPNAAGVR